MISTEGRLVAYPFVLLSELRDAANEHGYRIGPEEAGGWIFFRSAIAPGEVGLAACSASGPFFLSLLLPSVVRTLNFQLVTPCARGHAGAFRFATLDDLRLGVQAVYRLSVSLPDFPLERYERAVARIGETEGERAEKFRIGQHIFRDALMQYWNGICPLSGISSPALLRASHIMPWSACSNDAQRLDVHNGLLLSALWDAAFDAGLISFDDHGNVLISPHLDESARYALCGPQVRTIDLRMGHKGYLAYHRRCVWKNT
ncbi:HNH endonuclease [Tardiphaga alba]|uniref:HNH endonuclease n=1 Tax=Tardiphaga alba TaxID=340268 RepID=A0ABX8AAU9_9BRAD|nr:HNH endonuclease signature motif containing protein [Tardiphaga alba]QUS40607.1 HNH endonuclease [Tardiphaga alba]